MHLGSRWYVLNKIKAECEDDCCHPNEEIRNEPSVVQERLEYEHKRMPLEEKKEEFRFPVQNYYGSQSYYSFPGSSRSATSSAIPEAATEHSEDPEATKKDETAIRNAATDHSEKRRLLAFANENSQSGEAVTERSEIPGIACQEAKRPRKSEKETKRSLCADTVRLYKIRGHTDEDSEYYARIQEAIQEALSEIPKEKNATVPQPEALDAQCRPNRKATLSRKYSEPTLRRIHRRKEVLLNHNYTCKSQALYQAESHIVSDTLLTQIELDRIRADCRDKCCNPPSSSGGATPIPEAALEERRRPRKLPTLVNKNSRSSEAATEHSESPKAAKKVKTAIAEAVTKEKTQIPEAATEHSESSKATKEDKTAVPEPACEERKRPLPAFLPGQSIIQWWATWFKNADEPPKKYSKKNRPAWFSCEVLTYNGYKAIKYAGSQQEAQHCYVTYSWNGTSEEVPEQFLKKRLISEGEEKYAHSNGLHENQDCHLEPDFWQQFNTTNVNAAQSSSKKTMKRARSSTE